VHLVGFTVEIDIGPTQRRKCRFLTHEWVKALREKHLMLQNTNH